MWTKLLTIHKHQLDMSSVQFDGNHNDLFNIEVFFAKMLSDLEQSQIETNGLFLNADGGFDSEGFRNICLSKDIIANIDFNKRNLKNRRYASYFKL